MSQSVLVLNCGSSSLKYAVIDTRTGDKVLDGQADCLGSPDAGVTIKYQGKKINIAIPNANHKHALLESIRLIEEAKSQGVDCDIIAVGHRAVHGGEIFQESVLITDTVLDGIKQCATLAPLHNPANVQGMLIAQQIFNVPQVAVFDTAFHHTIPEHAYLYPLPYDVYKNHGVRKYGFHGSSFRYITQHMKSVLGNVAPNLVIAHLGNGGSLCAIRDGKSVDTTMGLTPLEGIVHGTRCGDIDPAIPEFMASSMDMSLSEVSDILWNKSGLLGISGISNDCRTLEDTMETDDKAKLALDIYAYRLAKHLVSMILAVGAPVDAIVFTGGIGENSTYIRNIVLKHLSFMDIYIDSDANINTIRGEQGDITTQDSKVPVYVVPTNEELVIAQDVIRIVGNME